MKPPPLVSSLRTLKAVPTIAATKMTIEGTKEERKEAERKASSNSSLKVSCGWCWGPSEETSPLGSGAAPGLDAPPRELLLDVEVALDVRSLSPGASTGIRPRGQLPRGCRRRVEDGQCLYGET